MTGLLPAGSERRKEKVKRGEREKGEERRRVEERRGEERRGEEKTGVSEICQSRRGLQCRVIQGSSSSVFIKLPDRNHGHPPQTIQFTRDKLAILTGDDTPGHCFPSCD